MENTPTKSVRFADFVKTIIDNWNRASVMQGAAEMAYYLLTSLAPILLVIANIIPLLPFNSADIIGLLENSFPEDINRILIPIISDYMQSASGGAISIGLLTSIWSASKVFSTLRRVLDEVYGTVDKKNFVIARLLSLAVMIVILFVVMATVFLFVFGEQIMNIIQSFFEIEIPFYQQVLQLRWIVLPVLLIAVAFIIYQMVPNHHLKRKYAVPGSIFATVGLMLLSQFFTLYSKYLGGNALANQTLGGFIVLMLFLYIASAIILLGALVNTLTFELLNKQSVLSFESELREKEKLEKTQWTGYPDESDVVILKRKLYKIND